MSTDPDQIRDEIRQTRQNLSADVDALAMIRAYARRNNLRLTVVAGLVVDDLARVPELAGA